MSYVNEHEIHKAIEFACIKHAKQKRKGTDTPYLSHIMEVYGILSRNGCRQDVLIAGILHDVLEDTDTTKEELIENFGKVVADMVIAESEDKSKSWKERKQATMNRLKTATLDVRQICCADKLSNLLSIHADIQKHGEKVWERFNADKESQKWYYAEVFKALKLRGFFPYNIFTKVYMDIFGDTLSVELLVDV